MAARNRTSRSWRRAQYAPVPCGSGALAHRVCHAAGRAHRQPVGNEFSLHSDNHKPGGFAGHRSSERRVMLRFKILVSVVPLIVAAILARVEFFGSPRPCLALGGGTLEIASAPWHADLH